MERLNAVLAQLLLAAAAPRGHCRYCGAVTQGASTCIAHRDLPPLDPGFRR